MRSLEFIDHTADIRMKVRADHVAELFDAALSGMNHLLMNDEKMPEGKLIEQRIDLRSGDLTSLLIEFLNEVLSLSYACRAIFYRFYPEVVGSQSIRGRIIGVGVRQFHEDIKAVTYHEAQVTRGADGKLETIVVFDI